MSLKYVLKKILQYMLLYYNSSINFIHYVKIKELRFKYKAMESKFLNEIEASKGSKRLLQKEVEMLMNSLVSKKYE